jgi:hypothetical protein
MDRRTALKLSLGAFAGLALSTGDAFARLIFPRDAKLDYLALRHDEVVGRQQLRFSRDSGDFTVRRDVELELQRLGGPAYRFVHHSQEIWANGWLSELISDTDDDGTLWRVRAERDENDIFKGVVNGLHFTVSGYAITSSLWHRDTPTQEALLDVIDARVKLIRGRDLGLETITLRGGEVEARHYSIWGEIQREVWYDTECRLVRVVLPVLEGTPITFELQ